MRTDAEFELWLDEIDEKWRGKFRRFTWEIALMTVLFFAAIITLLALGL